MRSIQFFCSRPYQNWEAIVDGLKGIFESQGNEEIKVRVIRRIVDRVEVEKGSLRIDNIG